MNGWNLLKQRTALTLLGLCAASGPVIANPVVAAKPNIIKTCVALTGQD